MRCRRGVSCQILSDKSLSPSVGIRSQYSSFKKWSLITLSVQSAGSDPAFNMQRGFRFRLRESHCLKRYLLEHWRKEEGRIRDNTYMRLVVVTEYCKSIRSQSGRQSQSDFVVLLICLKNSWAFIALRKGFLSNDQHFVPLFLNKGFCY